MRKLIYLIIFSVFLWSCRSDRILPTDSSEFEPHDIDEPFVFLGENGNNGEDGLDGQDGESANILNDQDKDGVPNFVEILADTNLASKQDLPQDLNLNNFDKIFLFASTGNS